MAVTSPADFCLWAPIKPDSTIPDTEGEEVAWCTKPGRGTRLIPAGALKGVQFMRTSDYVQVVGFIDQSLINIQSGDTGGELDPHGADLVGHSNTLIDMVLTSVFSAEIRSVVWFIPTPGPATTAPLHRLLNGISTSLHLRTQSLSSYTNIASWAVTPSASRSAIQRVPTLPTSANTSTIALDVLTTPLITRRMAPSSLVKERTRISPAYTPPTAPL